MSTIGYMNQEAAPPPDREPENLERGDGGAQPQWGNWEAFPN